MIKINNEVLTTNIIVVKSGLWVGNFFNHSIMVTLIFDFFFAQCIDYIDLNVQ